MTVIVQPPKVTQDSTMIEALERMNRNGQPQDEVSRALMVINDEANDLRHRGLYERANQLVRARVALARATKPKDQP